jgi:hypothetical protein
MDTETLVDMLGGPAKAGKICGVGTGAVLGWLKSRKSIPPWHWVAIMRHAEREKIPGVTYDAIREARRAARDRV